MELPLVHVGCYRCFTYYSVTYQIEYILRVLHNTCPNYGRYIDTYLTSLSLQTFILMFNDNGTNCNERNTFK